MQDLSLHLLDILENSTRAEATLIEVEIIINYKDDFVSFSITDNGIGMDSQTLKGALDPFYTSKIEREKKVGLGIPLFKQNAEHCNGKFYIKSEPGKGTSLFAQFQYSHIDRMPLGNIGETILSSIFGHPEINFVYKIQSLHKNGTVDDFGLDTKEIKDELGDLPITFPDVVLYLREYVRQEIKKITEE